MHPAPSYDGGGLDGAGWIALAMLVTNQLAEHFRGDAIDARVYRFFLRPVIVLPLLRFGVGGQLLQPEDVGVHTPVGLGDDEQRLAVHFVAMRARRPWART